MEIQFPWEGKPASVAPAAAPGILVPSKPPKQRGRRPASAETAAQAAAAGTAQGWRYHHLTISGPAADVAAIAAAAQGPGVVPWQLDFPAIEEDIFHLAVSPPPERRGLTVEGCRLLARQFRDRLEARHAKVLAATSAACPFDLQVLLPVPPALLRLGPHHPKALAWLDRHWGIIDYPRQVAVRPKPGIGRRLPAGHVVIGYGFFTADRSPHAAIAALGQRWPRLRFQLRLRAAD